jgi:hypothetical protein
MFVYLFVWWCLAPLSTIFQLYIVAVSFIGGGSQRKPPTWQSHWQTWSHNVVHLALIETNIYYSPPPLNLDITVVNVFGDLGSTRLIWDWDPTAYIVLSIDTAIHTFSREWNNFLLLTYTDYGAINWDKTTKDNSFSLLPQMRKSQNKKIAKLTPRENNHLYSNAFIS